MDFETLLRSVIEKHTQAILKAFQVQLQQGIVHAVFSHPGVVTVIPDGPSRFFLPFRVSQFANHSWWIITGDTHALQTHLVADEMAITTIDPRTGRINLRDTGDLAAAGRGPRFIAITEKLNENPTMLPEALVRLRLNVSWLAFFLFFCLTRS